MSLQALYSDLFKDTFKAKSVAYPVLKDKLQEFLKFKSENPGRPFGSSDKPLQKPFPDYVPKIMHAHLTKDLSVFYTISGANPTVLKLYGIFSHDDSGTGDTGKKNVQKNVAKRLANADF